MVNPKQPKQSDQKRRKMVSFFELKRLQYKSILKDFSITKEIRHIYINKLNNLPRNSSKTRINNRCILTGRSKSVYRFCKLSRISLRLLAGQGLIAGVIKSSW